MNRATKEIAELAKRALLADFTNGFEKHPDVTRVEWAQYAMYFNDGEPCDFEVRELQLYVGEEETRWRDPRKVDFPAVDSLDDGLMLMLFGNHVKVTLNRGSEQFTVEEYEHD